LLQLVALVRGQALVRERERVLVRGQALVWEQALVRVQHIQRLLIHQQ
jgi:hypothetical protein